MAELACAVADVTRGIGDIMNDVRGKGRSMKNAWVHETHDVRTRQGRRVKCMRRLQQRLQWHTNACTMMYEC